MRCLAEHRAAGALLAGAALWAAAASGCGEDCCSVDSYPILLTRAPLGVAPAELAPFFVDASLVPDAGITRDAGAVDAGGPDAGGLDGGSGSTSASLSPDGGALLALAAPPGVPAAQGSNMVIDTASPFTILAGPAGSTIETNPGGFDLFDATTPAGAASPPLRARFRDLDVFELPLQPVGGPGTLPQGILGADVLKAFSIELRFGALCAPGSSALCTSMTFWNHLGADASFLEDAGYAVIYFTLYGGGQVTADGDPDFLGLRGPLQVPATRVVLRTCAVPEAFSPVPPAGQMPPPRPKCCTIEDAMTLSSGVDLSLLVDTGVGPMVLAASAWQRLVTQAATETPALILAPLPAAPPAPPVSPLLVASWPTPIEVLLWATIPRFALVNNEIGTNDDPGPCVELGRSRRTEIVSYDTVMFPALDACTEPCDLDPSASGEALSSAAYLEIGGQIPVAVISDDEPFLQGLRFDVLPEGPELDGLVGAAALGRSRVELDYLSSPSRAVFSCEEDAPRETCFAAARCPRLPDSSYQHFCFGLPEHGLSPSCAPSGC